MSQEDSPAAREILTRFGSTEPVESLDGRGYTVNAEDAPAALQLILTEFASRGIQLYDAGMRRPTLDDVFLTLTGHTASTDDSETDTTDTAPAQKAQK